MTKKKCDNNENKNRDEVLRVQGWERRNIVSGPRLSELTELYRTLNYDVHVEPLTPRLMEHIGSECNECIIANPCDTRIIYTKPKVKNRIDNELEY